MAGSYSELMDRILQMPRAQAHEALYYAATGKKLDLTHPHNLNEKLQWLMVNRYDSNVSLFADKLAVRDYVRACGFEDILTELYGAYENGEDAYCDILSRSQTKRRKEQEASTAEDAFPDRYVLKCTHGSGPKFISICRNISEFDLKSETEKLGRSLSYDYSQVGLEHHYHYIRPLIIAEQYLGDSPVDYKFFCFSGQARYVKVIAGRGDGVHQDYYDMEGNYCPFVRDEVSMHGAAKGREGFAVLNKTVFAQMTRIASKLSEPFAVARVDLYYEQGRIYFGEITLTPATGLNRTDKPQTLELLGDCVDLSYERPQLYGFERTDEADRLIRRYRTEAESGENMTDNTSLKTGSYTAQVLAQLRNAAEQILKYPECLSRLDRQTANGIMSDSIRIINSDTAKDIRESYMSILYRLAYRDDMSLEECWQIYWNLNRALFLDYGLKPDGVDIDALYIYIFRFIEGMLDYSFVAGGDVRKVEDTHVAEVPCESHEEASQEEKGQESGTVILTTYQFLTSAHAPTQRLLDYAYALRHDLKKRVVIINDAGMHFYENETLKGGYLFTFLDRLNATDHIDYRDERFEFLQIPVLMPDIDMLQQLAMMVYSLHPQLVLSVGGSSLLADLCRRFAPTAAIPCSTQFPITAAEYMLLPRALEPEDEEHVRALGVCVSCGGEGNAMHVDESRQSGCACAENIGREGIIRKLIETGYNFVIRESSEVYTREQFDIPQDSPVLCTVGNRLDAEVNDGFLRILSRIYEGCMAARGDIPAQLPYMLFIGMLNDRDRILRALPMEARGFVRFTGPLRDASELVRHADIYLNPDRSGGGRSVFEACYYGTVPVSLRRGDGYYAAGPRFGADDENAYVRRVLDLLHDPALMHDQRSLAKERGAGLSDMTGTMKGILEACR